MTIQGLHHITEDVANLGQNLKLPLWLEIDRPAIEQRLKPIVLPGEKD